MEFTSLSSVVPAVVGVQKDGLLRFVFGPEAAEAAELSFHFGGMAKRL